MESEADKEFDFLVLATDGACIVWFWFNVIETHVYNQTSTGRVNVFWL